MIVKYVMIVGMKSMSRDRVLIRKMISIIVSRFVFLDLSVWEKYYSLEQLLIFYEMGYNEAMSAIIGLAMSGYLNDLNYRINAKGMVNTNVN